MVQTIVPPADHKRDPRLRVLEPYVDEIRLWSTQPGDGSGVVFREWACPLDPWVVRSIQRFCSSDDCEVHPVDKVVTEAVALLGKCVADLSPCSDTDLDLNHIFATQAELMLDVAVGMALVRDIQLKLNQLFADGRNEEARSLSKFHHDLRNVVFDVRRAIGEYEQARAENLADVFLPLRDALAMVVKRMPGEEGEKPDSGPTAAARRHHIKLNPRAGQPPKAKIIITHRPPQRSPRLDMALTSLVLLITITSTGFMLQRDPVGAAAATSPSLSGSLTGFPQIERIQDRPPYVVLTAKDDFWQAAGDPARLKWVQEVTKQAIRSGYEGLVVRSADGCPLAEWVKGQQIHMLPPPGASPRRTPIS